MTCECGRATFSDSDPFCSDECEERSRRVVAECDGGCLGKCFECRSERADYVYDLAKDEGLLDGRV